MDDVDVRESRNRNGETHGGRGGFVAPTDSPSRRGDSSFEENLDRMVQYTLLEEGIFR